jgi:hypothetical protein
VNRASPVELRKALEVANALTKAGIRFVCMPVCDEADHANLAGQAAERLERIATVIEAKERNHVQA